MKKVIMQHVVNVTGVGGPVTGFRLLMQSTLKDKFDFVALEQRIAANGINFKLLWSLYKQIKATKPDILHIRGLQSEGFYGVLAGRLAGCKKIALSVHGFYSDVIGLSNSKKWVFRYIIEPLTLRMASGIYCVCEYATKRPIIQRNAKNLRGYIHNAAPDVDLSVKQSYRDSFRKKFNIADHEVVICAVSRVTVDKGFPLLAQAIKNINRDVRFVIAGGGPYLDSLQQELKNEIDSKQVICLGDTKDVFPVLFASDIFVFPTQHENLSNALLEACASGLACVASNVGGNPEVIINEQTGYLFESNNKQDLVNKLQNLIDSEQKRKAFATNAQSYIKENFSKQKIMQALEKFYDSI
ncbi:glycosyltransferase [Emticicia sp. 17c]|uniref:glycosyltransferase n=1 Tax=Emticicia sp. 17c TaxID=3127704 RepID=UPI00301B8F6D